MNGLRFSKKSNFKTITMYEGIAESSRRLVTWIWDNSPLWDLYYTIYAAEYPDGFKVSEPDNGLNNF